MESDVVFRALDHFAIELPSWGFANTGTRFGKFIQDAAATTTEEKLADAGQVHAFTGCCPTVAMHVKWDFPCDNDLAAKYGVAIGSINPNLFEDQIYKHGSLGNPDPEVRAAALAHLVESVEIVPHHVVDVGGALGEVLDELAAMGLHGAIELADMARDEIAERRRIASDLFAEFGPGMVQHLLECGQPRRQQFPQLVAVGGDDLGDVLGAFLQRIGNGGAARIERFGDARGAGPQRLGYLGAT